MVKEVDANSDGNIDFYEFCIMMKPKLNESGAGDDADMIAAFKLFDTNGDGKINAEELQEAMKQLGENLTLTEAKDMIHEADVDGDNQIDFDEFKAMMNHGLM